MNTKQILLLNFGGPTHGGEVEGFLYELFRDKIGIRIGIPGFLQEILARIISRKRAPSVIQKYEEIGGGSPLNPVTFSLSKKLQKRLENCSVKVGMRYTEPFIEDVVLSYARKGIKEVLALPLYPQDSLATTGTAVWAMQRACVEIGYPIRFGIINAWYDDPGFLKLMGTQILRTLDEIPSHLEPVLLFCAHSIPQGYLKLKDPYLEQIEDYISLLIRQIRWKSSAKICFQSKVGPAKWLEPSVEEVLESYRGDRSKALVFVPISFISDHIETSHEIDIEYKALGKSLGIDHIYRVPCFNDDDEFVDVLAELIEKNLKPSTPYPGGFLKRAFPPKL